MTSEEKKQEKARERAAVIMAVRSGQITAVEGAIRLGVSRNTYYKWERRALGGMMRSLTDEEPGRPEDLLLADPEKDQLEQKVKALEKELEAAKQSDFVRRMLAAYEERVKAKASRKKNGR
ncbi:MAG: transposase [Candidatus Aureabacteria bacterium]|nr:transposase [Candidatus Auribacterota bacterium]